MEAGASARSLGQPVTRASLQPCLRQFRHTNMSDRTTLSIFNPPEKLL